METGQKLPEVLGIDQDGKEWTLAELAKSYSIFILATLLPAALTRLAICVTIMSVSSHWVMP